MEIKGKLTINCNRCGKSYDYSNENMNFTMTEKKGDDEHYVWEKSFNCVKCGNPISIKYEVILSPEGKVKDKKVEVKGAKVEEDSLDFSR